MDILRELLAAYEAVDTAPDRFWRWCVNHPRIEACILCALIYGAFYFAGTA